MPLKNGMGPRKDKVPMPTASRGPAARIRALVRQADKEELNCCHFVVVESFTLLRYLPDRHTPEFNPLAIRAHGAVVRQIRRDLAEIGNVDPTLPALANLLYAYLDGPYWFHDGEWISADLHMALVTLDLQTRQGYTDRPDDDMPDLPGDEWKRD